MSRTAFNELRNALRDIAESAPRSAAASDESDARIRDEIRAGAVTATYEIDHVNSSVLVLEVRIQG